MATRIRPDMTTARRIMRLKSRKIDHKVRIGESKDAIRMIDAELSTLKGKRKKEDPIP